MHLIEFVMHYGHVFLCKTNKILLIRDVKCLEAKPDNFALTLP